MSRVLIIIGATVILSSSVFMLLDAFPPSWGDEWNYETGGVILSIGLILLGLFRMFKEYKDKATR